MLQAALHFPSFHQELVEFGDTKAAIRKEDELLGVNRTASVSLIGTLEELRAEMKATDDSTAEKLIYWVSSQIPHMSDGFRQRMESWINENNSSALLDFMSVEQAKMARKVSESERPEFERFFKITTQKDFTFYFLTNY